VRADLAATERVGRAGSAAAADHVAAAADHQVTLERRLRSIPLGPPPPIALAHLAECRAEVSRARGDASAARWHECADGWAALGMPYSEAYAHLRAGEALLETGGSRRDAAVPLLSAHRIAIRLEAQPLLDEIGELAARCRVVLDATAPAEPALAPIPPATLLELTRRELQVLSLIDEGLSNSQIGRRLYISPKTVGVHVSHILEKLDVRNRTAAAAAAHRIGLLDRPSTPERSGVP
jgi:DNA-binding CsgD family transcriptional regulator